MNMTSVDIIARHRYRVTLVGNLYASGFCDVDVNFLLNMGLFDEYEPDVSRLDMRDDASELSSDSSSVSSVE